MLRWTTVYNFTLTFPPHVWTVDWFQQDGQNCNWWSDSIRKRSNCIISLPTDPLSRVHPISWSLSHVVEQRASLWVGALHGALGSTADVQPHWTTLIWTCALQFCARAMYIFQSFSEEGKWSELEVQSPWGLQLQVCMIMCRRAAAWLYLHLIPEAAEGKEVKHLWRGYRRHTAQLPGLNVTQLWTFLLSRKDVFVYAKWERWYRKCEVSLGKISLGVWSDNFGEVGQTCIALMSSRPHMHAQRHAARYSGTHPLTEGYWSFHLHQTNSPCLWPSDMNLCSSHVSSSFLIYLASGPDQGRHKVTKR